MGLGLWRGRRYRGEEKREGGGGVERGHGLQFLDFGLRVENTVFRRFGYVMRFKFWRLHVELSVECLNFFA